MALSVPITRCALNYRHLPIAGQGNRWLYMPKFQALKTQPENACLDKNEGLKRRHAKRETIEG